MTTIDLYDSEILEAEKVLAALNDKRGKVVDLEGFRKEAIGRFEEIGLVVDVRCWTSRLGEDVVEFEIEIQGRTEPRPFDYDRQVHEVTNDILELLPPQERGVIKSKKFEGETPKHGH